MYMDVRWDPRKAVANFRKHQVRFSDAETVLWDPQGLTVEDADARGEKRLITVGCDAVGRVLVVAFTIRGEEIRLISARKATRKERRAYEEGS